MRTSLDYCIETWDPRHRGRVEEPHHNTYDIEFWGPDGMCTSFYLGALAAAVLMGKALGDTVPLYAELLGRAGAVETELWNGEYFVQKIEWKNLRAKNPLETKSFVGEYSPEAVALLEKEGPKYQYGDGCLSDGVLGAWLAAVCGVGEVLDREKTASHLRAVHRHNLRHDLAATPTRSGPRTPAGRGRSADLHLAAGRRADAALRLLERGVDRHRVPGGVAPDDDGDGGRGARDRAACRDRYDGRVRNPFDEYECGHWYARAMSSYALLQGLTGVRYDAVERVLHVEPRAAATSGPSCRRRQATARSACATASRSSRCARGGSTWRRSTTGLTPDAGPPANAAAPGRR